MNIKQLIKKLSDYPSELKVFVHDGLDPSDFDEVTGIEREEQIVMGEKTDGIFITSY